MEERTAEETILRKVSGHIDKIGSLYPVIDSMQDSDLRAFDEMYLIGEKRHNSLQSLKTLTTIP